MLEGGLFKVAFNRQCSLELKKVDEQGKVFGTREQYGIRIMANLSGESYNEIKILITSEANLFMIYECRINEKKFDRLRKVQSLNFNFSNFLSMLIKQLGLCEKFPDKYQTALYLKPRPYCFTILENIEHKSIELLSLDF
jgi:hypothetical protein